MVIKIFQISPWEKSRWSGEWIEVYIDGGGLRVNTRKILILWWVVVVI